MSSEKTENLGLHTWVPDDYVQMVEFNENFKKIDEKAGELLNNSQESSEKIVEIAEQLADNKQYVNYKTAMVGGKTTSQAIQELTDLGTEKIYIPYGETVLTEPIVVRDGLEIIGFHNLNGKNNMTPMSTLVVNGFNAFINPDGTRAKINLKNIKIKGVQRTEVGVGSEIGGCFENVWFENLGKGFYSLEAWGSRFVNCFYNNCVIGAQLSQCFSVAFRDCTFNGNRVDIETLDDCVSFSVENCVINLGNYTDVSFVLRGDIALKNNYFEMFGSNVLDVAIDYTYNKFGNFALTVTNNSCGGGHKVNHAIRISLDDAQSGGVLAGEIAYNNFYNITGDEIVYGTFNDFFGPEIHNNTNSTVGNRHPRRAFKPISYSKLTPNTDISGTSSVMIPINHEIVYDNNDSFSGVSGAYTVRKIGVYKVKVNLTVKSTANDLKNITLAIRRNGVVVHTAIASLKYISDTTYQNVSTEIIISGVVGTQIDVYASNGGIVHAGNFSCEYLAEA